MAKAQKQYISFLKGIITECTPYTYPEGSCKDIENFIIKTDGSVNRRLGIDYEDSYSTFASSTPNFTKDDYRIVNQETWYNVAGIPNKNFTVIQIGSTVYFFDNSSSTLSDAYKTFTVNLNTYKTSAANIIDVASSPISVASGKGRLFICSKGIEPIYITYTEATDAIAVTTITIKVRDIEGIAESVAVDNRPASLTDTHKYNLLNQGWDTTKITAFQASQTTYPSNADIWHLGKDTSDVFDPALLVKQDFGTTPAPRGRFILNAFDKDRATASGIAGIAKVTTKYRPTCVAFYAGRVTYTGYYGEHYVSQVIKDDMSNVGYCYQEADPTSEHISDLVATDGVVVKINDIADFVATIPYNDILIILGTNGTWFLQGRDGIFKADDFSLSKKSTVGALSPLSVVVANGVPVWIKDSVYTISGNQLGDLSVTDIGVQTIKSLISEIPFVARQYMSGYFNANDKLIYWGYCTDIDNRFRQYCDTFLCYDTVLGCFYKHVLGIPDGLAPFVICPFSLNVSAEDVEVLTVVDSLGNQVVDSLGNDVIIEKKTINNQTEDFLFLTAIPSLSGTSFTFSRFSNTNFKDWYTFDSTGTDYDTFVLTAPELLTNMVVGKQAVWVQLTFERTETGFVPTMDGMDLVNPSGCYMSAYWDFAEDSSSNKVTKEWQVYKLNKYLQPSLTDTTLTTGFEVVTTKNKLPGTGKALSLKLRSEDGKDTRILGYSVIYETRDVV